MCAFLLQITQQGHKRQKKCTYHDKLQSNELVILHYLNTTDMDTKTFSIDSFKNCDEIDYCDGGLLLAFSRSNMPEVLTNKLLADFELAVLCHKGSCSMRLGGNRVVACAGSLTVCLENKEITDVIPSADFECDICGFSWNLVESTPAFNVVVWSLADYLARNPVVRPTTDEMQNLNVYFRQARQVVQSPRIFFRRELAVSIARSMLYDFARNVWDKLGSNSYMPEQKQQTARDFFDLLASGHGRYRQVKEAAQKLNVSPRLLAKTVKEFTGRRALDYINEYTLRNAAHLLRDTRMPIKEISHNTGFPDVVSFCKFVKKHTGKTSAECRKSLRKDITSNGGGGVSFRCRDATKDYQPRARIILRETVFTKSGDIPANPNPLAPAHRENDRLARTAISKRRNGKSRYQPVSDI